MGQAKQRGTLEVRKAAAVARQADANALRKAEDAAKEAALTPEQRERRRKSRMLLTTALGWAAGAVSR